MVCYDSTYIAHHGIKGQKWGVRRYQNPDGSLTDAGRARYQKKAERYRRSAELYRDDAQRWRNGRRFSTVGSGVLSGASAALGLVGTSVVAPPLVIAGAIAASAAVPAATAFAVSTGNAKASDLIAKSYERKYSDVKKILDANEEK